MFDQKRYSFSGIKSENAISNFAPIARLFFPSDRVVIFQRKPVAAFPLRMIIPRNFH